MSAAEHGRRAITRRSIAFSALCLLGFMIVVGIIDRDIIQAEMSTASASLLGRTTSWELPWTKVPVLMALGLGVGALSGFLGMGGGVVLMAALLILLRVDMGVARTVTMLTMLVASAGAAWHFRREGLRLGVAGWPMLAAALGGTAVGLAVALVTTTATLKTLFGFFMFFLGVFMLTQLLSTPDSSPTALEHQGPSRSSRKRIAGAIGAFHGALCGLLGISGGVVATPGQQMLLHTPTRRAIALSLVVSVPCTAIGSVALILVGAHQGTPHLLRALTLFAFVGLPAAAGAHLGARLSGRVNKAFLAIAFALLYLVGSLSILL